MALACVAVVALLVVVGGCYGSIISNAFGSHMVMQAAPRSSTIYGWATAGGAIRVYFDEMLVASVTADKGTGKWKATLPPVDASFVAHEVYVVDTTANAKQTLEDVLFGDVYVCGGQSNMQMTVGDSMNAAAEIAAADNYPMIRVFTVGQNNYSTVPLDEFASIVQPWTSASASSIGGPSWAYFSAVCWFFGRELFDRQQIPIGLISDNWGGTYIEAWSSPDALAVCSYCNSGDSTPPNMLSVLWNAMIVPILDLTVKGAVWYQGESNAGNYECYMCSFPAMINDWRAKWGVTPDQFGFFFVQLAPYIEGDPGDALPYQRIAQTAALSLPYVGMASAVDLGDITSPQGDIHPTDKQDVGLRLALSVEHFLYGNTTTVYEGPTVSSITKESDGPDASVLVVYAKDSVGSGLVFNDPTCPDGVSKKQCGYTAELQASNGDWYEADIYYVNPTSIRLKVSFTLSHTVTGVRYIFSEWPMCYIFNEEGLPAVPFLWEF
ncbi:sialate O-acetylesterase [Pelomyxa schiedti]|nr:sialate O-acetylesterase [Pelomyxa schiedti]